MTTRLTLPAILDLPATAALADRLREATGSLMLDGAAVERIGTPALQLFLSAQVAAEAGGTRFAITDPSAALQAAAGTIGATRLLATAG